METRKIATLQQSIFSELGEVWIKDGLVAEDILYKVLASHSDNEMQFQALVSQGVIEEAQLLQDLASAMACPFWDTDSLQQEANPQLELIEKFPRDTLEQLCVAPISLKDGYLLVALSSWPSPSIFTTLQRHVPAQSVVFGFAERASILHLINLAYDQVNDQTMATAPLREDPTQPTAASSSINANLFDDSWDDWEVVTTSQPAMPQASQSGASQSQAVASQPVASSAGPGVGSQVYDEALESFSQDNVAAEESVDDLLASFLTPDEELPAASNVFQSRSSADSFARSLPAVDAAVTPSSEQWSQSQQRAAASPGRASPRIMSASPSSSSLNAAIPTGLEALKAARSSSEWDAAPENASSGSILGAKTNPHQNDWSVGSIQGLGAIEKGELAEARKASAKQRAKKKKGKNAARNASIMAFVLTIVRILAIVGIGYLIYLGYQNGI